MHPHPWPDPRVPESSPDPLYLNYLKPYSLTGISRPNSSRAGLEPDIHPTFFHAPPAAPLRPSFAELCARKATQSEHHCGLSSTLPPLLFSPRCLSLPREAARPLRPWAKGGSAPRSAASCTAGPDRPPVPFLRSRRHLILSLPRSTPRSLALLLLRLLLLVPLLYLSLFPFLETHPRPQLRRRFPYRRRAVPDECGRARMRYRRQHQPKHQRQQHRQERHQLGKRPLSTLVSPGTVMVRPRPARRRSRSPPPPFPSRAESRGNGNGVRCSSTRIPTKKGGRLGQPPLSGSGGVRSTQLSDEAHSSWHRSPLAGMTSRGGA